MKVYNQSKHKDKRRILRNNPTNSETLLWQVLKGKKLAGYKFRRQYGVGRYVIDFYCPKVKVAIEVDGPIHVKTDEIEYDKQRDSYLSEFGIKVIRFKNEDMEKDLEGVIKKIEFELKKTSPFPLLARVSQNPLVFTLEE